MLSEKHLSDLHRILVEACFGNGTSPSWLEMARHKDRLLSLLEQFENSPGEAVCSALSKRDFGLLAAAAEAVRDELGADDLFIRAGIAPTECEDLIRAVKEEMRSRT